MVQRAHRSPARSSIWRLREVSESGFVRSYSKLEVQAWKGVGDSASAVCVQDAPHVCQHHGSVAALKALHELQVVAHLEARDGLLLGDKAGTTHYIIMCTLGTDHSHTLAHAHIQPHIICTL